jgi:hypothetical protein
MIPEPTTTQTKAAVPMYSARLFLKISAAPNIGDSPFYFGEPLTS